MIPGDRRPPMAIYRPKSLSLLNCCNAAFTYCCICQLLVCNKPHRYIPRAPGQGQRTDRVVRGADGDGVAAGIPADRKRVVHESAAAGVLPAQAADVETGTHR